MSSAITRDQHDVLSTELNEMRTSRRAVAEDRLRDALDASGGARTPEVEAAEQEREHLEAGIRQLDQYLRALEVGADTARPGAAGLGSHVTARRLPSGAPRRYTLVLPFAGDRRQGLLAVDSPLGQALMGSTAGEQVTVDGPTGPTTVAVDAVDD